MANVSWRFRFSFAGTGKGLDHRSVTTSQVRFTLLSYKGTCYFAKLPTNLNTHSFISPLLLQRMYFAFTSNFYSFSFLSALVPFLVLLLSLNFYPNSILLSTINNRLPLVIFRRSCSFPHDANEAFRASVIFLFVPGVRGGTCAGISAKKKNINYIINMKNNNFQIIEWFGSIPDFINTFHSQYFRLNSIFRF